MSEVKSQMLETHQEVDKGERELSLDESLRSTASSGVSAATATPLHSQRLLDKIYHSEKKAVAAAIVGEPPAEPIIRSHANANELFALTLLVTEANKICTLLGFDYELRRYGPSPAAICLVDKRLGLVTLWNRDTFEQKLCLLRDIYACRQSEQDVSISSTSSSASQQQQQQQFITDGADEWQTLESFTNNDDTFSPRMYEEHELNLPTMDFSYSVNCAICLC